MIDLQPLGRRSLLLSAGFWLAASARRARGQDQAKAGSGPCASAQSRCQIGAPGEPGVRMRVKGRLFAPDGERAAGGVILYAYHTDAEGYYNRQAGAPPRLQGWMRTDTEGRFEYETIRPGAYPGRSVPAHVHHQAWGGGWPTQYLRDLNFTDDPLVSESDKKASANAGRFAWVLLPRPEQSVLVVELSLRLKPTGDVMGNNIRHGLEACGLG